jgi:hypothetical protein
MPLRVRIALLHRAAPIQHMRGASAKKKKNSCAATLINSNHNSKMFAASARSYHGGYG